MRKVDVPGLKYPKKVAEIHEVYKQALIEEFNSNNRTEEFIRELVEVVFIKNIPLEIININHHQSNQTGYL